MQQLNLGVILSIRAMQCYNLTGAVPEEHEAALWEQGDELSAGAKAFGFDESEYWGMTPKERGY